LALVKISPIWVPDARLAIPTATQAVAEAQLTEVSTPLLEGRVPGDHVVPPFAVVRTRPVVPALLEPTATQAVADEQLIPMIGPVPAGSVCGAHVVPPLVVTAISPVCDTALVALNPTARHVVADVQSIDSRRPRLAGSVSAVQVVPASVLDSTTEPLDVVPRAKQSVAVGQLTWVKGPVPEGRLPTVHVVPFVVLRVPPNSSWFAPVVTHVVAAEQSIPSSSPMVAGTDCAVHVAPPSAL
jgi:hypothetical protein